MWEWHNEIDMNSTSDVWLLHASDYLRSIDPYQRLITNSHPRNADPMFLDFKSPHAYSSYVSYFDPTVGQTNKPVGMPYIIGEAGHGNGSSPACDPRGTSTDPVSNPSEEYFRSQIWTAFFGGIGVIYWNNSSFYPDCFSMYIGSIERKFNKILRKYSIEFPSDSQSVKMPNKDGINIYTITSDYVIGVYATSNPGTSISRTVTFQLSIPFSGNAFWIDPSTGTILQTLAVADGVTDFTSPEFTQDIALKVLTHSIIPSSLNTAVDTASSIYHDGGALASPTDLVFESQAISSTLFNESKVNLRWKEWLIKLASPLIGFVVIHSCLQLYLFNPSPIKLLLPIRAIHIVSLPSVRQEMSRQVRLLLFILPHRPRLMCQLFRCRERSMLTGMEIM